jgi:uncharacterized protein
MILEGIVTTLSPDEHVNIAPMGPIVDAKMEHLVLRPFRTAQTYRNLKAHGEGVLHVTDDVLLLAQSAVGALETTPAMFPARKVRGWVLQDTCRFFEFRVLTCDDSDERTRIEAAVVYRESLRDFFGFNRAKHAVVEAAILATRIDFMPLDDIEDEFRKLAVLVHKTGGDQEARAFAFLEEHVRTVRRKRST